MRKEIKVKPGYTPPEDVKRYKNRAAEGWSAPRGVVGAEGLGGGVGPGRAGDAVGGREEAGQGKSVGVAEGAKSVSANARRRENTRRKAAEASGGESTRTGAAEGDSWADEPQTDGAALEEKLAGVSISSLPRDQSTSKATSTSPPLRIPKAPSETNAPRRNVETANGDHKPPTSNSNDRSSDENQRKVRATLKKLRAITELKARMKTSGEKLSPDQLVKVGKEEELRRDLKKLGYEGGDDDKGDEM